MPSYWGARTYHADGRVRCMGSSAAIKFGTCNLWRAPHRKTSRMDVPERFATGDIAAFGLLFRQFHPVVLRSGTAGRGEVIQPRKLIDQRDRIGSNSEFFLAGDHGPPPPRCRRGARVSKDESGHCGKVVHPHAGDVKKLASRYEGGFSDFNTAQFDQYASAPARNRQLPA